MKISLTLLTGLLLASVHAAEQKKPNVIVFLSDDVGYGEFGFQGNKQIPTPNIDSIAADGVRFTSATTLEGGTRVPFCMKWRGKIQPGTTFDHPIQNLDVLPTALVAAGGKVDPDWKLDGVDLMPFLSGKEKSPPHEVLYWRFGGQWAVRKGDWKLCANSIDGIKNVKLFNLKDDIGEATDLSAKDPEKVKELQALWDKWSAEQAAPAWLPRDPAKPGRKASSRKRASKGK